MASKITGYQGVVFVEDGYDYDSTGESYFEVWRGSRAAILTKAAALKAAGYRVARRKYSGPLYEVTGTLSLAPESGGGGASETPVDRYRITTQLAMLDIRSNPQLIALAGDEGTLALWIRTIDQWIKDEANSTSAVSGGAWPGGWSTEAKKVADIWARGTTSYELKRCVLTRVRSISVNYASPFVMDEGGVPKVYTTSALETAFDLPASIVARLPADPSTAPADCTWGWMWTQQDSDTIPALSRVEEMDSWIFAAWSDYVYDIVT